MSMIAFSGRVALRIFNSGRLFDWYLLIRHFCTLGWIVLSVLVGWVAGAVFLHTAASAAADAQVLQSRVLVGLLRASHGHLQGTSHPLEER